MYNETKGLVNSTVRSMNNKFSACELINITAFGICAALISYAIYGWMNGEICIPSRRYYRDGSCYFGERVPLLALSYSFGGLHIWLIAAKICANNKYKILIKVGLWITAILWALFLFGSLTFENAKGF